MTPVESTDFNVVRNDCATTATMHTSAMPIISAEAVAAVRRGLRALFSRASLPEAPSIRGSGAPSARAAGRAMRGLSTATATKITRAPPPISVSVKAVEPTEPNNPIPASATPTNNAITPAVVRAAVPDDVNTPSSRRAAIGAMRAALNAGSTDALTVTPTPTTIAAMIVRGFSSRGPSGSEKPAAANAARMPIANSTPRPSDTSVLSTPISKDSVSTDRRTCVPVAPRARSSPSSRMR